jgi:hypothetical protein
MHLLPSADQGATTKPGRKWRVETRGCCDRCVELLLVPVSTAMGFASACSLTSGERHTPCGGPTHKRPRNIAQPGALRVRFNENFPRG